MERAFVFFLSMVVFTLRVNAQTETELKPIEISGGLFKSYRYEGTKIKNVKEIEHIVVRLKDEEVNRSLSTAKNWNITAMVAAYSGGALIGYPVGSAVAGKKFNTPLFSSGCAIVGVNWSRGSRPSNGGCFIRDNGFTLAGKLTRTQT